MKKGPAVSDGASLRGSGDQTAETMHPKNRSDHNVC